MKDLDVDHGAVIVHKGKDGKDRVVMVTLSLVQGLRQQLNAARSIWMQDQEAGRAVSSCRMLWNASTQGPVSHGCGSGCSHRPITSTSQLAFYQLLVPRLPVRRMVDW